MNHPYDPENPSPLSSVPHKLLNPTQAQTGQDDATDHEALGETPDEMLLEAQPQAARPELARPELPQGPHASWPREIALDFPIGDGRTGSCLVRLFRSPDENLAMASGAGDAALVVALVETPPGGGGFDLAQYAASIANTLCHRENFPPDHLLYIDHDQDRASRLSQWAVLLGPQVMQSYDASVNQGAFDNEAFCLVAFDFKAGALTNPRFTPLSRLDIEGILGQPFA